MQYECDALNYLPSVVGKTQVIYILIPRTCGYVTLKGKRDFAAVIKLNWGRISPLDGETILDWAGQGGRSVGQREIWRCYPASFEDGGRSHKPNFGHLLPHPHSQLMTLFPTSLTKLKQSEFHPLDDHLYPSSTCSSCSLNHPSSCPKPIPPLSSTFDLLSPPQGLCPSKSLLSSL